MDWLRRPVSPNNTFLNFVNGGSWTAVEAGSASSIALSALSNSTTANTLDSVNYAQTWTWNSPLHANRLHDQHKLGSHRRDAGKPASHSSFGYLDWLRAEHLRQHDGVGLWRIQLHVGGGQFGLRDLRQRRERQWVRWLFHQHLDRLCRVFQRQTGAALNATASAPTRQTIQKWQGIRITERLTTEAPDYYPANGSLSTAVTTEASAGTRSVVSRSGTVQNLYYVANPASTSTITVYHNGSSTAITCSTSNSTSCSDTSDTVSVSAGDQLGVAISATTTAAKGAWSIELAY